MRRCTCVRPVEMRLYEGSGSGATKSSGYTLVDVATGRVVQSVTVCCTAVLNQGRAAISHGNLLVRARGNNRLAVATAVLVPAQLSPRQPHAVGQR